MTFETDSKIIDKDGRSALLSQMIERPDCPLSIGMRDNLRSLKTIRDQVEHSLLGRADFKWLGLFQACCLNFDKAIRELFGDQLTLANELSFALQFTKPDLAQIATISKYDIPEGIEALDARLTESMSEERQADMEYKLRVIYTLDAASKSKAHFEFIRPEFAEGKEIRNVLVQYKAADDLYPHKAKRVCELVSKGTGHKFSMTNHTRAHRYFKVRPKSGAVQPENTNKEFCIYHQAHKDYTYSQKWVDRLIDAVKDVKQFAAIKAVNLK